MAEVKRDEQCPYCGRKLHLTLGGLLSCFSCGLENVDDNEECAEHERYLRQSGEPDGYDDYNHDDY